MPPLLEQFVVAIVATLVMCYPGALVVGALGGRRVLPAYLLPAAALCVGLVALLPPLYLGLELQLSGQSVLGLWGVVSVGLGLAATSLRDWRFDDRRGMVAWLWQESPLGWLVALPRTVVALCSVVATIAFVLGGWLDDGDMMYHTAIARKLAELPGMTFANIQLFVDGDLHPGYAVPTWHEMVSITSLLTGADVATVMWIGAVPAAVISTLAMCGLAFVLLRSHVAAIVAGVVFIVADSLARAPLYGAIPAAVAPSALTTHALIPFALGCWFLQLWHPGKPVRRRAGVLLLGAAMPAIIIVHASYVAFLGMLVAGYLVIWALRAPWPREVVLRHLGASTALAAVTGLGLLAMAPVLRLLVTFDAAHKEGALRTELAEYAAIMVGTAEQGFHLRPDVVTWFGGLAFAGAACSLLALRRMREPAAWLVLGASALVFVVSQSDVLFPAFSSVASMHQAKRIQYALPWELSLTMGVLLAADLGSRLWRRGFRWRGALAAGGVGAVFGLLAWRVPPLPTVKDGPTMPLVVPQALHVALIAAVAALVVAFVVRVLRRGGGGGGGGVAVGGRASATMAFTAPSAMSRRKSVAVPADAAGGTVADRAARAEAGRRARRQRRDQLPPLARPAIAAVAPLPGMVAAVLVLASLPIVVPAAGDLAQAAAKRPASALQAYDLRRVDPEVVRALRAAPPGTVVMSELIPALRLEAVAPVYGVGVRLTHVARTRRNRPERRRELVNRFYAAGSSDEVRVASLERGKAQLVVTSSRRTDAVHAFCAANPDLFEQVAAGRRDTVWRYLDAGVLDS